MTASGAVSAELLAPVANMLAARIAKPRWERNSQVTPNPPHPT
jgi:hypothetical protein